MSQNEVSFQVKYYYSEYIMECEKLKSNFSHQHKETWTNSEILYCPSCGKQDTVWISKGNADYYEGEMHLCISCGFSFTMPSCSDVKPKKLNAQDQKRKENILKFIFRKKEEQKKSFCAFNHESKDEEALPVIDDVLASDREYIEKLYKKE